MKVLLIAMNTTTIEEGILVLSYGHTLSLLDASMMNIHDHIRDCPSWQAIVWRGFKESLVATRGFFAALRMTGKADMASEHSLWCGKP